MNPLRLVFNIPRWATGSEAIYAYSWPPGKGVAFEPRQKYDIVSTGLNLAEELCTILPLLWKIICDNIPSCLLSLVEVRWIQSCTSKASPTRCSFPCFHFLLQLSRSLKVCSGGFGHPSESKGMCEAEGYRRGVWRKPNIWCTPPCKICLCNSRFASSSVSFRNTHGKLECLSVVPECVWENVWGFLYARTLY